MFNLFRFSVFLLLGLQIFSVAGEDCPKDECAPTPPAVDANGNILMTIWYDNDDPYDEYQWNTNMVLRACQAMEVFKNKFSVEFMIGSGSGVSNEKELICKHDCEADRREGCVALLLSDAAKFSNFVCCNNNGGTDEDCAEDQGVAPSALSDCVKNRGSDQLLMDNGDKRRNTGIPGCHVPEFAFNNVIDRCLKITTTDELKKALCDIFDSGDISIDGC